MIEKKILVEIIHFSNNRFFEKLPPIFLESYMKILDEGRNYVYLNKKKFSKFTTTFVHRILLLKFEHNNYKKFDLKDVLNRFETFYRRIIKKNNNTVQNPPAVHFTFSCSYRFINLFIITEKIDI